MESATFGRPSPLPGLIQAGLVTLLVVIAGVSWAVTTDRMAGMDAGPGTDLGGLGWFTGVWVTMMAAMMLPSIAPMVLAHARTLRRAHRGWAGHAGAISSFVAGYLVAWGAAGLAGYTIIEGMRSLGIGFLAWDQAGRYVTGGVILGAAVYQFSPLKDKCLRRCRTPGTFFVEHWRGGRLGALRTGIEHGGFCVGCCWALMAALFALGVMSIAWMACFAALIAIEKLVPWKAIANRGIAIALALIALTVAIAPHDVPGLTVPGSPEAAGAMDAMGMDGGGGMETQPR